VITLPYEYISGKTLLAELDPDHYITDKKKVVAKLTADSLWAKPIKRIDPTGELILLSSEHEELTADWNRFQDWLSVQKHLPGQHDQSTHGRKKTYTSADDLIRDGLDIRATVDELGGGFTGFSAKEGNVAIRVLLERKGKGGKPEIVDSVDDLDGEPIYRGAADVTNDSFRTNEYDRLGVGKYGDGYYFSSALTTADAYAQAAGADKSYGDNKPDVMTAGWKKDAKVYSVPFGLDEDGYPMDWSSTAGNSRFGVLNKLPLPHLMSDAQKAVFDLFYRDPGNALVTNLILEGYDGMTLRAMGNETYTVVFNREALQVVGN